MTDPEERPSRQDAFFDSVAAFLQRHALGIALLGPIVVVALLPFGSAAVLVVLVIYLGEAILYGVMRRGDPVGRGVHSGPGPGLQALYGVLATIVILGGLVGLGSSGESVPIVPVLTISLEIGILVWVGHRVSRASGEDTAGRGVHSVPGPGLQALYGVLATIFILGGLVGIGSSGESVPIVPILAIALGIGIIVWVWRRVSRASGDRTTALAGRMAGIVGRTGGSLVLTLAVRLIFAAAVAGVAWLIALVTKVFD